MSPEDRGGPSHAIEVLHIMRRMDLRLTYLLTYYAKIKDLLTNYHH